MMRPRSTRFTLLALCALGIVTGPALAAELQMDFERPTYRPGSLTGQGGWVVLNATEVVAAPSPAIGEQSVRLIGYGLLGYREVRPSVTATEISWWWYYDSSTYELDDPQRSLAFLDPSSRPLVDLSREDHLLWIRLGGTSTPWIPLGFDMPWDRWVQFRVLVDSDTLDANLYVDGAWAYSYVAPSTEVGNVVLIGDSSGSGNDIYMDNIRVVPEPTTLLLASLLGLWLRRR